MRNGSLSFLRVNEERAPLFEFFHVGFSMNAIPDVVGNVREGGDAQDEAIHQTGSGQGGKIFDSNCHISNELVSVVEALLQIWQSLFTSKAV